MNQLRILIRNMKPKEIEVLTFALTRSRGRSKKRYQLFCILKENDCIHEHIIITKLYGDGENSKQNYRKLLFRLEKDVFKTVEQRKISSESMNQIGRGILSLQSLNILFTNDYEASIIQAEIKNMFRDAENNQSFFNQILLERVKCESFYLSTCPLASIEKMKPLHEISQFVTESNFFHMSCKRHYLIESDNWELLIQTQNTIHGYYIKCNEPLVGFHYHAGSIIMNFIRQELQSCCYHIDQLNYLAKKHEMFKIDEFNDELVLLNLLCSSLKVNGSNELKQFSEQNFYNFFSSTKESLFQRVQTKPFEMDVLIQFLIIYEDYKAALSLINTVLKNGLLKNSEPLSKRLNKYNLIANSVTGNYNEAKLILKQIQSNRKSYDDIRFYIPMYKYIIHSELTAIEYLDNIESFCRSLRRNITLFHKHDLSCKEIELLQTIYRFLLKRLSAKNSDKNIEDILLNNLKYNFTITDINYLHELVLIKWLDKNLAYPFKNIIRPLRNGIKDENRPRYI